MTPLQRLARRLGYDLTLRRKAKSPNAQLVAVLEHFRISCVLDVGANAGQYGAAAGVGLPGRIVSFEPQAAPMPRSRRAAWPARRGGAAHRARARDGKVELVSAESDMSLDPAAGRAARQAVAELRRGAQGHRAAAVDGVAGSTSRPATACSSRSTRRATRPRSWPAPPGCSSACRHPAGDGARAAVPGRAPVPRHARRARGARLRALFLPGYFERKLARQLQLDGVFMRSSAAGFND